MQHTLTKRSSFRLSMLAGALGLALSGLAHAQANFVSPETATVTGRAPIVETAIITGTPSGAGGVYIAGDMLTATFTITDPDNDAPDIAATNLTVQWTSNGAPVGTPGSLTYVIEASDARNVITYSLIPKTDAATTDPSEGVLTIASDVGSDGTGTGGVITPPSSDLLLAVDVAGNAVVGDTLTANPSCVATCTGNITYQWKIETGVGTGVYVDIPSATNATYSPVARISASASRSRAASLKATDTPPPMPNSAPFRFPEWGLHARHRNRTHRRHRSWLRRASTGRRLRP
jgi:hypothetical protein